MELSDEAVYEVIATYFANRFWNNLFTAAQELVRKKEAGAKGSISIEDAYKEVVNLYVTAICEPNSREEKRNRSYLTAIDELHSYFNSKAQTSYDFGGFVSMVVKIMMGKNYRFLSGDHRKRELAFRMIFCKTLASFAKYILDRNESERLKPLSNHDNADIARSTLEKWRDRFIETLEEERDRFCGILLQEICGADRGSNFVMPREISRKLREAIKRLVYDKNEAERRYDRMMNYAKQLYDLLKQERATAAELRARLNVRAGDANIEEVRRPEEVAAEPLDDEVSALGDDVASIDDN